MSVRSLVSTLIILLSCSVLSAQTESADSAATALDSISLGEVTVTAAPVIRKVDRDVYIPSEAVKTKSENGIALLKNVQIPSLFVDNVMETITAGGSDVQLRINDRVATIRDVKALEPSSIVRVEYLDNPGLRYNGATSVINFVVRNPTVGGSLMLNAMQTIPTPLTNGAAMLKLNHSRSQWGANIFFNQLDNMNFDLVTREVYRLASQSVERTSRTSDSNFAHNWIWGGIYYNYLVPDKTNLYVNLQGGFQPRNVNRYTMMTEGTDITSLTIFSDKHSKSQYPSISVYLDQKIGRKQTLVFNTEVGWRLEDNSSVYRESPEMSSVTPVDIDNRTKSRNFDFSFETNYIKEWNKFNLTAGAKYYQAWYRNEYYLPDYLVRHQGQKSFYTFAEAQARFGKFNLSAGLGGEYTYSHPDGAESESHFIWRPRFSASYRAGDVSRFNLTLSSWSQNPSLTQMSDVVTETDRYQISTGNANLRSFANYNFNFTYMFTKPRVTFQTRLTWWRSPEMISSYRYLDPTIDKIVQSYANQSFSRVTLSISPRIIVVPDWLTISGDIRFSRNFQRGPGYRNIINSWSGNYQAEVSHWGFTLSAQAYYAPKWVTGQDWSEGERITILSLSYKWKQWNFAAGVFTPWGGYTQRSGTDSPVYNSHTRMTTTSIEHRPFVSVNYNLQWGHQKRAGQRLIDAPSNDGGGKNSAI